MRSYNYVRAMVAVVTLGTFFLGLVPSALAVGVQIKVTVDNELTGSNRLTGATLNFRCNGDTTAAVVDNGASDSNAGVGIISVPSSQSNFFKGTVGGAGCDTNAEAFTVASVS